MAINISGTVALITGANRGIGRHCAHALAREGCKLALLARSRDKLAQVEEECRRLSVEVLPLAADVRDEQALRGAVEQAAGTLGGLNILVNNAGVWHPSPIDNADTGQLAEMVETNLTATMKLTALAMPQILTGIRQHKRRGAVIFVASMSGVRTYPGGAGYCASKFGVVGFSKAVFDDVAGEGVKVSAICPGWVNTDMAADAPVDGGKLIQPEEVAELVRMVATWPDTGCPRLIELMPQLRMDPGV